MADVLDLLTRNTSLSDVQRTNLRSSIRTFCRVLDRPAASVPIEARTLRLLIAEARPGPAGVKPARWRNITSDLRRALRLSGLSQRAAPSAPLSDAWQALLVLVPDKWAQFSLGVLARYCSERQIAPGEVTQEHFEGFEDWLAETRSYKDPHRSANVAARHWRRSAAAHPDSWPQVDLQARSRRVVYALTWEDLPASLHKEVEAFHQRSRHPDPFDPGAPPAVRPSTIQFRDALLRRMAGALIERGIGSDELATLNDLVRPDRVREALRFFHDRNGGKMSTQMRGAADLALVIGRHWLKLPTDQLAELDQIARRLRKGSRRHGLTERNRERLRPFNDERLLRRLLALPDELVAEARRGPMTKRKALKVQTAVAIEILLFAPIRVSNLMALDRDRHFRRVRYKGADELHLVLCAAEVKNSVDMEFPLPSTALRLIEFYMETCQPLLVDGSTNRLLFPGRSGKSKHGSGFWIQLRNTCQKKLGLQMNPHLFRHLAGFVHLSQHPGEHETVRRLLGHRSIETTTSAYTGLETLSAARHYDRTILGLRDGDGAAAKRPEK